MAGIYVHIPFCARLCDYCDFNRYAGLDDLIPRYVDGLRAEIIRTATSRSWPEFTSVFVGGGTPTLLPPQLLAGVLTGLRDAFPIAADAEVTVEANPETVTADGMAQLVAAGMTRVSMGAQSFAPHVLATLGRWHEPQAPLRAVAACREAGVAQLNLDLIYGTPGESDADFAASLATAVDAGVDHLSAYALTVEAGTGYAARIRQGEAIAPDEDVQAARMQQADATLEAAGFARYEISNWAKPGNACRHNLTYWHGGDWLAFGAGAHGHWQGRRWWAVRPPGRYSDLALAGASTTAGEEHLSPEERRTERLLLGLRMVAGVARHAVEPLDERAVRRYVAAGLLEDDGTTICLTRAGFPLAGAVTVDLLAGTIRADATAAAAVARR